MSGSSSPRSSWTPIPLAASFSCAFVSSPALGLVYEVLSPLGVIWDARNLRRIHDQTPPDRDGEATRRSERLAALLGRTGRSLIPLWPSGLAEFDGLRIDAIADGGMS